MKVFATNFFEQMSSDQVDKSQVWNWQPVDSDVEDIYASGANTKSQSSTYAAETDNRSDSDRPNEGLSVA